MRLYFEALFCETVESLLNRLLRLDPDSQKILEPLAGKTIRIELKPPGLSFILAPTEKEIYILRRGGESDVVLRGSPLGFLRLLRSEDPRGELFAGAVEVEGDLEVAQKLQRLLRHFEIDWEGLLGEEPATFLQEIFHWQRESWKALQQDLADHLQEETRALPHRLEFEDFAREVGRLRNDVERLEVRLKRFETAFDR